MVKTLFTIIFISAFSNAAYAITFNCDFDAGGGAGIYGASGYEPITVTSSNGIDECNWQFERTSTAEKNQKEDIAVWPDVYFGKAMAEIKAYHKLTIVDELYSFEAYGLVSVTSEEMGVGSGRVLSNFWLTTDEPIHIELKVTQSNTFTSNWENYVFTRHLSNDDPEATFLEKSSDDLNTRTKSIEALLTKGSHYFEIDARVEDRSWIRSGNQTTNDFFHYIINVSPVPAPPTLWMFSAGVAGIA
ncbi:MAG: hypothetical protein EOP48_07155 [Sphingobacteriales bacterium]|nr:MAG: hypothetical protein EOP48_07155 [Sphingobacteriales bacterium]